MLLCFSFDWRRISQTLRTPEPKKSYYHSGPSPIRPNESWTCAEREPPGPGLCPWLSTALDVSPFEEEGEGIGIASDVVQVKVEETVTIGSLRAWGGQGEGARWQSIS